MLKPRPSQELYNPELSAQWAEWVELENTEGSRQKEIYPVIKKWLEHVKPASIVDLGCGQGICSQVVDAEIAYQGIDASTTLIKRARQRYAAPSRTFTVGDVYRTPLEDSSVDATMSVWVWSHLEDLSRASQEMRRILKPGGSFLIINANPDTYEERKGFYSSYEIEGNLLVGTFDLGGGRKLTDGTLYLHSREDMASALAHAHLLVDGTVTLGYKDEYPDGLYIALSGHKETDHA